MINFITKAYEFSKNAHKGQMRKYTGLPYITHPEAVATIALKKSGYCDTVMLAAAFLHDVVEDTEVTILEIEQEFGQDVAGLVWALTDISIGSKENRAARKKLDREHIAKALPAAKTIKLADLIDNMGSIVQHDPKFAKVYMKEKVLLLEVLKDGDALLWETANKIVQDYYKGAELCQ